ncbi:hypothetical protein ACFOU2_07555 [Bacillus songklensis]|uniref:Uncharacterized protein n=1 Tax=Bacillus songklensis TaxID=1069116 RepID=A0ABV8B176_9BACI
MLELLTEELLFSSVGRSEMTERLGAAAGQFQRAIYTFLYTKKGPSCC